MQRAKSKKSVKLPGRYYNSDRELVIAKTSDAADVVCFIGPSPEGKIHEYFHVEEGTGNTYTLTTPKGSYVLVKHPTQGYWHTQVNGIKVHFMPKKVIAELIFWA